jgi:hypothetical protein
VKRDTVPAHSIVLIVSQGFCKSEFSIHCMESHKDSWERIFLQLKNDGAILPSHTIVSTEKYQYFHAGFRTVHYNPTMNMLDDTAIKFCLLHEEGHIRNQYRTGLFLLFLGIILITIIFVVQIILP